MISDLGSSCKQFLRYPLILEWQTLLVGVVGARLHNHTIVRDRFSASLPSAGAPTTDEHVDHMRRLVGVDKARELDLV